MASGDAKYAPGGHYSGRNPVPNIQQFIERMDRDKKKRDAELSAQQTATGGEAQPHKDPGTGRHKSRTKTVTDPTTGRQVEIEDVDDTFVEAARNPKVCLEMIICKADCLP